MRGLSGEKLLLEESPHERDPHSHPVPLSDVARSRGAVGVEASAGIPPVSRACLVTVGRFRFGLRRKLDGFLLASTNISN